MDRIDIDDEDGDDVSTGKKEKESCPSVQTFPLPLTVPRFIFSFFFCCYLCLFSYRKLWQFY